MASWNLKANFKNMYVGRVSGLEFIQQYIFWPGGLFISNDWTIHG
jgi:hypothetical protein